MNGTIARLQNTIMERQRVFRQKNKRDFCPPTYKVKDRRDLLPTYKIQL